MPASGIEEEGGGLWIVRMLLLFRTNVTESIKSQKHAFCGIWRGYV